MLAQQPPIDERVFMADETLRLEGIPEPMRGPIQDYAALVRETAGAGAKSLTLTGAIAAGTFDATRHSVRSVLVLESIDLDMLRRFSEHGPKLGKRFIAAPLIMTDEYIKSSLDTFPLELIEISQAHITLFGDDPFVDMTFDDTHVRLQCEREFKTVLISLRQGLLTAAGRDKVLKAVELEIGDQLVRTLRGVLWLDGKKKSKPATDVVSEVGSLAKRKLTGIRATLDVSGEHGWEQFQSLYRDVEALTEMADAW